MHNYQAVIFRLRQGQTPRSIAKDGVIGRNKAYEIKRIAERRGWLKKDSVLPNDEILATVFQRATPRKQEPLAAHFEQEIKKWVQEGLQATVIHRHLVEQYNFSGQYSSVRRLAKRHKEQLNTDLTVPLYFKPGEAAQVDFGKGPRLFDLRVGKEVDTWFFVMTLCWSRHQYVEIITHQDIETWLSCHQHAFEAFGGVPKKIIIDNPKCAITKACYQNPEVQRSYESVAFYYFSLPTKRPTKERSR